MSAAIESIDHLGHWLVNLMKKEGLESEQICNTDMTESYLKLWPGKHTSPCVCTHTHTYTIYTIKTVNND